MVKKLALLLLGLLMMSLSVSASCPTDLFNNQAFVKYTSEPLLAILKVEINESNKGDLLDLELTQDATHVLEAMPSFIPGRAMLFAAKMQLRKKMSELLKLEKKDPRQPRIISMQLKKDQVSYGDRISTAQLTLWLQVRREYLLPILNNYFSSLNHPSLGNFVIRMDVDRIL